MSSMSGSIVVADHIYVVMAGQSNSHAAIQNYFTKKIKDGLEILGKSGQVTFIDDPSKMLNTNGAYYMTLADNGKQLKLSEDTELRLLNHNMINQVGFGVRLPIPNKYLLYILYRINLHFLGVHCAQG